MGASGTSRELKQLQGKNTDLQFLSQEKENRIQDLQKQVNEMRQKLGEALQTTAFKKSTEIQKVFSAQKDADDVSAQF